MRLIDADKIKYDDITITNSRGIVITRKAVMQRTIEDMPTIEQRPKGKWIREYDGQCETCSLCHRTRYSGHDNNFCPNCGAEMEVEE